MYVELGRKVSFEPGLTCMAPGRGETYSKTSRYPDADTDCDKDTDRQRSNVVRAMMGIVNPWLEVDGTSHRCAGQLVNASERPEPDNMLRRHSVYCQSQTMPASGIKFVDDLAGIVCVGTATNVAEAMQYTRDVLELFDLSVDVFQPGFHHRLNLRTLGFVAVLEF